MKALYLCGVLVGVVWFVAVPMGESAQQSTLKEPAFAALEEGDESYKGVIKDEGTESRITDITFFGHTTVGGIRQESNDSMTKLDLANLKSLKVLKPTYSSTRYPEKDFCLVQKTTNSGDVEEVLVPRHIIICGIDEQSKDQRSWYLSKIDELIIEKGATPEPAVKELEEKIKAAPDVKVPAKKKSVTVTEPITVKEQYREMEVKIVEKKPGATESKSVIGAVTDLVQAFVNVIKAIFNFIKGLVW